MSEQSQQSDCMLDLYQSQVKTDNKNCKYADEVIWGGGRYLDMEGERRRRVSSGSLERGLRTDSPLVKLRPKCGSKYEADMERLKTNEIRI